MAQDLSYIEISRRIKNFTFPEADIVIGIAEGGLVPAALTAYSTGLELKIIRINYRNEDNTPRYNEPMMLNFNLDDLNGKIILLVDDVSVSGKTLEFAKSFLKGNEVITFTLKGKADYVLFPEIKDCVNWPWKLHR